MGSKLHLPQILAGLLLVLFICTAIVFTLRSARTAVVWTKHISPKLGISFDYPSDWEVLYDTATIKADVMLCPPEKQRIATRLLFANCITFFVGQRLLEPENEMEGDNAVLSDFRKTITDDSTHYNDYRILDSNAPDGIGSNVTGLYRDGAINMAGVWQPSCGPEDRAKCIQVFKHVLSSLQFTVGIKAATEVNQYDDRY